MTAADAVGNGAKLVTGLVALGSGLRPEKL